MNSMVINLTGTLIGGNMSLDIKLSDEMVKLLDYYAEFGELSRGEVINRMFVIMRALKDSREANMGTHLAIIREEEGGDILVSKIMGI